MKNNFMITYLYTLFIYFGFSMNCLYFIIENFDRAKHLYRIRTEKKIVQCL